MGQKLFYSLALAVSLPLFSSGCTTQSSWTAPGKTSWMDKVGSSVKGGSSKLVGVLAPKKDTAFDPSPPPNGKPGAGVYVAMAQLSERNQNFDEAEAQYKKALAIDANHLGGLMGLAHLEDRRNNLEVATKLYQKAAKKHPKDASTHNDLGLCFHRRGMLNEAGKSLQRAVALQADNKLYRNNLAAVYVEQGKTKDALSQLTAAHGEAVGNYNLAYLLAQKQDNSAALVHFRKAAEKDPSLVAAQQWIAKLSPAENHNASTAFPDRNGYATAAGQGTNPTYVADATGSGLQRASGVSQYPAGGVGTGMENRGIQYPPARPSNGAADAMPPTPGNNRLPSTSGNGG